MIHQLENLISFKMVYYKPYLVSILDLDDFFVKVTSKLSFLLREFCQIKG